MAARCMQAGYAVKGSAKWHTPADRSTCIDRHLGSLRNLLYDELVYDSLPFVLNPQQKLVLGPWEWAVIWPRRQACPLQGCGCACRACMPAAGLSTSLSCQLFRELAREVAGAAVCNPSSLLKWTVWLLHHARLEQHQATRRLQGAPGPSCSCCAAGLSWSTARSCS